MWPIKVHYLRWLSTQLDNTRARCIQMGESYGAHKADYEISNFLKDGKSSAAYHKKMYEMYEKRMLWYIKKYYRETELI